MADWMLLPAGVEKRVLHGGRGNIPDFVDNSKVVFHYRTFYEKDNKEIILDDSKKDNSPFELIIGKKFKLEIWESIIKTMRVNEVALFMCSPNHVASYPVVSKSLRDMRKKEHKHKHNHDHDEHTGHQCGYAALTQGLGYPDLDLYMKEPTPLTFQIELISFTSAGEYEPDVWSLSLDERLTKIPQWKEEGNSYYKKGDYENAQLIYSQAIGSLEQLMTREKPGTEEFVKLERMKIPFLLNFSQCLLSKNDYYQAITHLTTVIEIDADNVKALYRRGKAYQSVYNFEDARCDYSKAKELDSSLSKTIDKELENINRTERQKNMEDKEKFKNVLNNL